MSNLQPGRDAEFWIVHMGRTPPIRTGPYDLQTALSIAEQTTWRIATSALKMVWGLESESLTCSGEPGCSRRPRLHPIRLPCPAARTRCPAPLILVGCRSQIALAEAEEDDP
jgi:hypothetical protein